MNFRTSTLLGAATVVFALASLPSIPAAATGSLKLTGPDGQTRVEVSQYGPTSPSDTFWSIAQKTRPDPSISVYQMMAAIFEANPHAFSSDNYNSLEKGMILAIPSQDVIQAIPVSLAKSRAEQDDRAWQAMLKREAEKPTVAEVQAAANSQAVEKAEEELEQVNESLMQAQSRNLNLTDELGRALDQLVVIKNDNDNLKAKISDLNDRVATLEQELITAREQNQSLRQKVEQLEWEASQAALPPEEPPFITSPLGLGLISAIVTLLLLIGLWLVLKRKSNKANAADGAATTVAAAGAGAAAAVVATDTMADDADELAVHLDEPDDSIDSLLDAGDVDLEPEADLSGDDADMYVADDEPEPTPEPDDSQSLDDLWAEAMGEQEEGEARREDEDGLEEVDTAEPETDISADIEDELEPIEDAAPISADDDLDSLIADLESDIESDADARAAIDEDVDDMAFETDSEEADVDALLAGLDADAEATEFAETDDALDSDASQVIEANSDAGLDDELNDALADMDLPDESDPDALLAELQNEVSADEAIEEQPVISEQAQTTEIDLDAFQQSENTDTDTELDAEPGAELDSELDDAMAEMDLPGTDDVDAEALLAELQNDTPTESAEQSDDAGIDTELDAEQGTEPGAELDSELDDAMAEMDLPGTDDADAEALLAELQNDTPTESSEQSDHSGIDSAPNAESGAELDSELDDAMAEMDLPGTDDVDAEALLAELQNDTPTESADQSDDADIDTELDAEQGAEPGAELDSELDDAMAEMDLPGTDDVDAEALLAELQNDTPTKSAEQNDDAGIDTELGAEAGAELDSELDDAMAEMDLPAADDTDAEALLAGLQTQNTEESADIDAQAADYDSGADGLEAEVQTPDVSDLDARAELGTSEVPVAEADEADVEALVAALESDPADEEIERKLEEEARQTTPEQISTELGDSDIAQNELSESTSDAEEIQMTQEDSAGGDSPEMPQTLSEVEPAIEELAESEQSLDALLDPELTQQTDVTEPFDTDSAELSEPEPVQELDDMLADLASTDDADSIAEPQAEETLDALAEPADETSELAEEGLPSNDNAELLDDTPVLDESATLSEEADTDIALEAEPLDGDNLLPVDGTAVEAQAVEGDELTSLDDPMAELEQLQQESQVQSPENDPLAELQELETSNTAYTGESLDDDLLDELGSDEAQTFSADELDALDDNGDPIQQGVNPSVVANVDPSEVMNMSSLERSERAMDEAMSRSELRAMHRAEALARAKAAEEDEIEVTDDELAEMASMTPTQPVVTETQDDPFGDALSLDQHDAEMSLSDEELLAAFAENSEESGETDTDIESGVDTSNMTVAEALAALDAKEKAQKQELAQEAETSPQVEPPRQAHFDENDLANFQKENGYIDIDRLLNEADESEDVDNYQGPSDVAMNGYPNMVGNSAMVDVDDEENSVNAKLDLARAYIEIDDNDSARALLQEVAIDGNDRQQDEARSLMEKIG